MRVKLMNIKSTLEDNYSLIWREFLELQIQRSSDAVKLFGNANSYLVLQVIAWHNFLIVTKSLGRYKPIILIIEPNGGIYDRKYHNQPGYTVNELVEFGEEIGYELIGMSGELHRESGNLYFIRNDFKSKFDICKNHWTERGLLLEDGVPIERKLERISNERKFVEL